MSRTIRNKALKTYCKLFHNGHGDHIAGIGARPVWGYSDYYGSFLAGYREPYPREKLQDWRHAHADSKTNNDRGPGKSYKKRKSKQMRFRQINMIRAELQGREAVNLKEKALNLKEKNRYW